MLLVSSEMTLGILLTVGDEFICKSMLWDHIAETMNSVSFGSCWKLLSYI